MLDEIALRDSRFSCHTSNGKSAYVSINTTTANYTKPSESHVQPQCVIANETEQARKKMIS